MADEAIGMDRRAKRKEKTVDDVERKNGREVKASLTNGKITMRSRILSIARDVTNMSSD